MKFRVQRIQNTGFPNAGVACKGRYLSGNQRFQLFQPLPGFRADPQGLEPGGGVNAVQLVCRVQIALVQQDDNLTVLQRRNSCHPVNEKGIGLGNCRRTNDHQLVDIGNGRPGKGVLPGQDCLHEALAVSKLPHCHPISHQRGLAVLSELASGSAGQDFRADIHIIEPAEGLLNSSFRHTFS